MSSSVLTAVNRAESFQPAAPGQNTPRNRAPLRPSCRLLDLLKTRRAERSWEGAGDSLRSKCVILQRETCFRLTTRQNLRRRKLYGTSQRYKSPRSTFTVKSRSEAFLWNAPRPSAVLMYSVRSHANRPPCLFVLSSCASLSLWKNAKQNTAVTQQHSNRSVPIKRVQTGGAAHNVKSARHCRAKKNIPAAPWLTAWHAQQTYRYKYFYIFLTVK